ncbi:hypothetical protein DSECCO2_655560 [anaerobic digester metagenome]|nr:hypothetical protein [Euryarchaeota archaeon]
MATEYAYVQSAKSLKELFSKLPKIGVPPKATPEWLVSLGFKSRDDRRLLPVLEQIGFVDSSKTPTELWPKYRGENRGKALAEGILKGYQDLFKLYPDAYSKDGELIDYFSTQTLAGQVTVQRMVKTFKALCEMADFNGVTQQTATVEGNASLTAPETLTNITPVKTAGLGENITLNINIQITLPESKDIEIYDNIFSSMRKHIFPKGTE